ncbi:N-acetylmuramoyl-L-alanine amidase [Candidatus Rhodobacter oscarellae]|uniref:N-acetylmuramoyl-L-alanine amidase n=2 Tax=Candidatus Rhodobacter oscarellae TaxID=1675527 RepID=A0A0J9E589_9RHOB|nr:N-acetylmuramoyl-L-alanine amidase [Candidatus Rhodobacter lobularis]
MAAHAQEFTGLARVDAARSGVTDLRAGAELRLGLSQPVPFRAFTLDNPRRLVLDFSVVAWQGFDAAGFDRSVAISDIRVGTISAGWSRMVAALDAPMKVASAELRTTGAAELVVALEEVSAEQFAASAGAPPSDNFTLPEPAELVAPRARPGGERPVVVVLDPGHGGIDPGAERGEAVEADLMLQFARELREALLRAGGFEVVLTRDADVFVPLEMRLSVARSAQADVFLSLHADALAEGRASGATIYTLAGEATDIASEKLAERHDRAELLAGVDLSQQDDAVAKLLMDLARADTWPRTDRLADALVEGLRSNVGDLHKRPRQSAAFSVLKAPDVPSVLIELGFMSSERDLANLQSPEWRARAARGIRDALRVWAKEDAAEGELLRQ